MQWYRILMIVVLLGVSFMPPSVQQTRAQAVVGAPIFFAETGQTVAYSFRNFFESKGGIPIFGLPLTRVFLEDGRPVQYFERARLEWNGGIAQVQIGQLGRWVAQDRMHLPAFQPVEQSPQGTMLFSQTGHSLRGLFMQFWIQQGGRPIFGYPISEEFEEIQPHNGQPLLVQYFERARFELHIDSAGAAQVQLGHIGRQYLAANAVPEWVFQPVAAVEQAWDAVRVSHITIPRISVDAPVSMAGFAFGEWDVPRYTVAQYWPVSAVPNTQGNIVLAGHVGYPGTLFSHLPGIQAGDEIFVMAGGIQKRYITDEVLTLLPHDTWVMQPTPTETLTLITCIPVRVYSHRLVVRASPAPDF